MGKRPAIHNLDAVETVSFGHGDRFAANIARLGGDLGLKQLGCTLVEVEPGKRAWPYHQHFQQDELFLILAGSGSLRYDGDEYDIRAGDLIAAPAGPGSAHQIVNSSDAPLRYLALSSTSTVEVVEYPDSNKLGAYVRRDDQVPVRMLLHPEDTLDYWDGE
jgi:uncharacterized cupin superfamily protein